MNEKDRIQQERTRQHGALKQLADTFGPTTKTGLQIWRQLRRAEKVGNELGVALCSRDVSEREQELAEYQIRSKVSRALGGIPKGFFVNRDPRGYALKLEAGSYPSIGLHEDWGRYQILAPEID